MIEITYGEHLSERQCLLATRYYHDDGGVMVGNVSCLSTIVLCHTRHDVTRHTTSSLFALFFLATDFVRCCCFQKIYRKFIITMIGSTLARASRPVVVRQQRRGIINWMVNYPDKVSAIFFTTSSRSGG